MYHDTHADFAARLLTISNETAKPINVLVTGPTGCGKTSWAENLAEVGQRPYYMLEGGSVLDADQLFGDTQLGQTESGAPITRFVPSPFVDAIQTPGTVVCIDEINRFQQVRTQSALFGMLGHQRILPLPDRSVVHVAERVIFVATINQGAGYAATDAMDLAILSRFSRTLHLDYLSRDEEVEILQEQFPSEKNATISNVVNIISRLRGTAALSLRNSAAALEEMRYGASLTDAITVASQGMVSIDHITAALALYA